VLPADPRAVRQHAAQGQDPVRLRLSRHGAGALDGGLRQAAHQAGGAAADTEGERGEAARIEMKLHTYFRSSAAFRVRIALDLRDTASVAPSVHPAKGNPRQPAYGALNPQGLLPTLEDEGQRLTQSLAIIEYLEETHPRPALLPKDPIGRARVRSLSLLVAC